MSTTPQSQGRTRAFARVLGPYLVIATVAALSRASEMPALLSQFKEGLVWSWVGGAFVLLSGLIVIALHPYWNGLSAITVSVVGWGAALKGLLLLAIPQSYLTFGESVIGAGPWWQVVMVVMALVGLYLTYVGWAPAGDQPDAEAGRKRTTDLPRAA